MSYDLLVDAVFYEGLLLLFGLLTGLLIYEVNSTFYIEFLSV